MSKPDELATNDELSAYLFGAIAAYRTVTAALKATRGRNRIELVDAIWDRQTALFAEIEAARK